MRDCITIHGQWMYPREDAAKMIGLAHAAANAGPFKMTIVTP
jgi:hypothetical protein